MIIAISIKEFSSVRLIGGRKGVPKIGNKVWIGINACIVGNVTIGYDVLIAPNSYVNRMCRLIPLCLEIRVLSNIVIMQRKTI